MYSTYRQLCWIIAPTWQSPDDDLLFEALYSPEFDWNGIVQLAHGYYLTAALWRGLIKKDLLQHIPVELAEFLEEVYKLNQARNQVIKKLALELIMKFNSIDIAPLLLKGGVVLFEQQSDAAGDRMMSDLDFVVRDREFDECLKALKEIGYTTAGDDGTWISACPDLIRAGDVAYIDLHRSVGEQRSFLSVDDALKDSVWLNAGGGKVKALEPTHRVIHNILHAQVQDRCYSLGKIPLKSLHDLAILVSINGKEIDWDAVRQAFYPYGLGNVVDAHILLLKELFGLSELNVCRSSLRASFQNWRCIQQLRYRTISSAITVLGALTHPFRLSAIDCLYDCHRGHFYLNLYRIRRCGEMFGKYRGRVFGRVKEIYDEWYMRKRGSHDNNSD